MRWWVLALFVTSAAYGSVEVAPPTLPTTAGGLAKDVVRVAVKEHQQWLQACYDAATKRGAAIEARIVVSWTIQPAGDVANVVVQNATGADDAFLACVTTEVKSWKFPIATAATTVSFPFVFRRGKAGVLPKEVIRGVIRTHLAEVQACYEAQLAKDPTLAGRVMTRFVIGPDGTVVGSQIAETTLHDTATERCITEKMTSWKFPAPDGGVVIVSYPFVLKTAEQ